MTENQKKHAIIEIKEEISNSKSECGSCKLWMTQQCNREKHHKVSCGEKKCEQFNIKTWSSEFIAKKEKELEELINSKTESDFAGWGL